MDNIILFSYSKLKMLNHFQHHVLCRYNDSEVKRPGNKFKISISGIKNKKPYNIYTNPFLKI